MTTLYIEGLLNQIKTLNSAIAQPAEEAPPTNSIPAKAIHNSTFELKKLQYKTAEMEKQRQLKQPVQTKFKQESVMCSSDEINTMIDSEYLSSYNQTWGKLTTVYKLNRVNNYINNILKPKYSLSDEEIDMVKQLLHSAIKSKSLSTTHVNYDKLTGSILNIPKLIYNADEKVFILNIIPKVGAKH